MENLPTPLSRVELYLAKACGMDVTVPEQPIGRLEQFLAILAGDTSIAMPTPMSLTEQWLAYVLGVTPDPLLTVEGACLIGAQKVDVRYFAVAASMPGATLPEAPQNRAEMYWAHIAVNPPTPGILKYVTGKYFNLTDVVSGIEELQYVKGDTYQQTYSGKNLIDFATINFAGANDGSGTRSGSTYTVTASSNSTYSGIQFTQGSNLNLKPDTTYTFGATVQSTENPNGSMVFVIGAYTVGGSNIAGNFAKAGERSVATFTTPSSIPNNASIRLYPRAIDATAVFTDIMVEESATATSYEPYVGGIPAPNPDYPQPIQVVTGEQTVTVCGKNLLPLTSQSFSIGDLNYVVENGKLKMTGSRNPEVQRTSPQFKNNFSFILPAGTYTAKCTESGTRTGTINLYVMDKSNDSEIAAIPKTGSNSFTLAQDTEVYFGIYSYQLSISDTMMYEIQVEKGSTPTDWQPYQSNVYTVDLGATELCKIGTYQDYIYNSGDDWYVHKEIEKVVLDGGDDEGWGSHNIRNSIYGFSWPTAGAAHSDSAILATAFRSVPITTYNSNSERSYGMIATLESGTSSVNSTMFITQPDSDTNTLAKFTTWLGTHTPTTYYAKITPTDTKITDTTLISQLEALNSAQLPKPTANITVSATGTNLTPYLTIAYYGSDEE